MQGFTYFSLLIFLLVLCIAASLSVLMQWIRLQRSRLDNTGGQDVSGRLGVGMDLEYGAQVPEMVECSKDDEDDGAGVGPALATPSLQRE